MQQPDANTALEEFEPPTVEHLAAYVIGFPVFIAVTIRTKPGIAMNAIPAADLIALNECIGVEVRDSAGAVIHTYRPRPLVDPDLGEPGVRLSPGESRRMLTDISPTLGRLMAGEYTLQVSYVIPDAAYHAPPFTVRFRNPTTAEMAMLAAVAPDRAGVANWAIWTTTRPLLPVYTGAIRQDHPLLLNLFLRRLFYGQEPLARLNPTLLDAMEGLYRPEREALQAELYYARGDQEHYLQLRAKILRDSPGLAWWVRMIDEGGAYLKTFRVEPSP